jgi:hypothetical protein
MKIYDALVIFSNVRLKPFWEILFSYYLEQKYGSIIFYFIRICFKFNKEHFVKISCGGVVVNF